MSALLDIPVCILAGGQSRRFGSNKALALLAGKPLVVHVLDRISSQTQAPIAINCDDAKALSGLGRPIVLDHTWISEGPLCGIFAAIVLAKAQGYDDVVTVAVDLPCLPEDLIRTLSNACAPCVAASQTRWHPVNGLWATSQVRDLDDYLRSGRRSAHGWAKYCRAKIAEFDNQVGGFDPFYNINTLGDLQHLARNQSRY